MLVSCRVGELGEPSKTRRAYAGIYRIIAYHIMSYHNYVYIYIYIGANLRRNSIAWWSMFVALFWD